MRAFTNHLFFCIGGISLLLSMNVYAEDIHGLKEPISAVMKKGQLNLVGPLITEQYKKDPHLKSAHIKVYDTTGIVTLTGTVDTEEQFIHAVYLALKTKGVLSVNPHGIKIKKMVNPLEDLHICAYALYKIHETGMFASDEPDEWPIQVKTIHEVVYLSGELNKKSEINKVIQAVKNIDHLHGVESAIIVKSRRHKVHHHKDDDIHLDLD